MGRAAGIIKWCPNMNQTTHIDFEMGQKQGGGGSLEFWG